MDLSVRYLGHQSEQEAIEVAAAWAIATRALYWYQRPFRRWLFAAPAGMIVDHADIDADESIS